MIRNTCISFVFLLLGAFKVSAVNYYLDHSGNDSNSGTSLAEAWKTFNSTLLTPLIAWLTNQG